MGVSSNGLSLVIRVLIVSSCFLPFISFSLQDARTKRKEQEGKIVLERRMII